CRRRRASRRPLLCITAPESAAESATAAARRQEAWGHFARRWHMEPDIRHRSAATLLRDRRLFAQARRDAVGHEQVAGVGRGDAVALGQGYDFIDQLFLLAVDADLIEQVADLAAGPQIFDKSLVIAGLIREVQLVDKLLALLADVAHELDGCVVL